jgi:hypothetical protein
MTNPNSIDPSTLILKMVGGNLDGKIIPISTQKCFLTGNGNDTEEHCAIFRGPSGTAIKSSGQKIVVNGHTDTLHWLNEGDSIEIGQTTIIVQQLGSFGPESTKEPVVATAAPVAFADMNLPNEQTETAASPQPHSEPTTTPQNLETVETQTTTQEELASEAPQLDSQSSNNDCDEESTSASAPKTDEIVHSESEEASDVEPKPRLNNELLERALASLKAPVDESTHQVADTNTPNTEEAVGQRLDEIQDELESQIQSYDSLAKEQSLENTEPESNLSEAEAVENLNETFEETQALEDQSKPQDSEPAQDSIDSILGRLGQTSSVELSSSPGPSVETPATQEPIANSEVDSAEAILNRLIQEPSPESSPLQTENPSFATAPTQEQSLELPEQAEETQAAGESVEDILSRLTQDAQPEKPVVPTQEEQPNESSPAFAQPEASVEQPETKPESESVEDILSRLCVPDSQSPEANLESDLPSAPTLEPKPELDSFQSNQAQANDLDVSASKEITASVTEQAPEAETTLPNEPETVESEPAVNPESIAPPSEEEQNSVAAVLARMNAAGQLDESGQAMEESVPQPILTPEPTPTAEAQPATVAQPAEADGETGDVQDYMNQLFQRLRGSDAPQPAPQQDNTPAESKPQQPAQSAPTIPDPPKEVQRVLTPTEYVPQQQAPEVKSDLEAMRELANKQKSAAVGNCSTKRFAVESLACQLVGFASLAAAALLGWMSSSMTDPLMLMALLGLFVAFGAGIRYSMLKNAKDNNRNVVKATPAEALPVANSNESLEAHSLDEQAQV